MTPRRCVVGFFTVLTLSVAVQAQPERQANNDRDVVRNSSPLIIFGEPQAYRIITEKLFQDLGTALLTFIDPLIAELNKH